MTAFPRHNIRINDDGMMMNKPNVGFILRKAKKKQEWKPRMEEEKSRRDSQLPTLGRGGELPEPEEAKLQFSTESRRIFNNSKR